MEAKVYDLIWKKGSFFENGHWRLIPKKTFGEKAGGQLFVFFLFLTLLLILLSCIIMTLPLWACLLSFQMKRKKRYIGSIICLLGLIYFNLDISNNWVSAILFNGWTNEDGTFTSGFLGQKYIYWFKIINYTSCGLALGFVLDYFFLLLRKKENKLQLFFYIVPTVLLLFFFSKNSINQVSIFKNKKTSVYSKPNSNPKKSINKEAYRGNGVFNSIINAKKHPKKVKELKIGFGSYANFPIELRKMVNLESLEMEFNKLREIPNWINELKKLKKLDLHRNNIKLIPKALLELKNLEILNLNRNEIIEMPNGLEQLINLNSLHLSNNPINRKNALRITKSLPDVKIYGLDKVITNSFTIIEPGGKANFNKKWRSVQIKENKKWGVIDDKNNLIIPFEYENMIRFDKDANSNKWYSLAKKNGKYGVIDIKNNLLIEFKYKVLWPFYEDGYAPCKLSKEGKFGLIDVFDNKIIDFKYDGLHHVKSGYVAAKLNGLWGYIDLNENIIVDFKYKSTTKLFDLGEKELKSKKQLQLK